MKKITIETHKHGSRERYFSEYGGPAWHRAPSIHVDFLHDTYDWWTRIRENFEL